MRRLAPWLILALLVVVGAVAERSYNARLAASRQQADALRGKAEYKEGVARSWQIIAESHIQYAATLAKTAKKRDTVIRERVRGLDSTIASLPDTGTAPRDSVIAEAREIITDQQGNFATLERSLAGQMSATAALQIANDSLIDANTSLKQANHLLRYPPRRPILAVLLHPKIKPAVFTGVCT